MNNLITLRDITRALRVLNDELLHEMAEKINLKPSGLSKIENQRAYMDKQTFRWLMDRYSIKTAMVLKYEVLYQKHLDTPLQNEGFTNALTFRSKHYEELGRAFEKAVNYDLESIIEMTKETMPQTIIKLVLEWFRESQQEDKR